MKELSKEIILTSESSGERWSAAMWDPLTGTMLNQYKSAAALGINCLQLLKDSYILGADASKPRLYIWQVNKQIPIPNLRLTTPGKISALACTSSGLYMAASINEKIFIWQLSTGKLLKILERHFQRVTCLKFSSDSSILASGGEDGLVFLWSLTRITNNNNNYKETYNVPLYGFSDHTLAVKDLHFCNNGLINKSRLITVSLDRTARIYDTSCGIQLLILIFDKPLTSVCLDIKEYNMFVGCSTGEIQKFNLRVPPRTKEYHVPKDNNSGFTFKGHVNSITKLCVSSDCNNLLSASDDGHVNIWDINSCQIIKIIDHKTPITNAIFLPAHVNFNLDIIEPKIIVKPLQRATNQTQINTIIEVVSCNNNYRDLLEYDHYFSADQNENNDCRKTMIETRAELERLKKINSEIYKYGVNCLFKQNLK